MKLLCIDHGLELAELRCMVLSSCGFECIACPRTRASLELRSGAFDALILSSQVSEAEDREIVESAPGGAASPHLRPETLGSAELHFQDFSERAA
jgi:hypothetical protein